MRALFALILIFFSSHDAFAACDFFRFVEDRISMAPELQEKQYVVDVNNRVRSALDTWLASVEVRRKEISPDGKHVVFISDAYKPYLARVRSDGEIQIIELRLTPKARVEVVTDSKTNAQTLRETTNPEGDDAHGWDFAFSPNGKYLAVSGYRPGSPNQTQNIEVYSLAALQTKPASEALVKERRMEFTDQVGPDGKTRNLRQAFVDARIALPIESRHLSPHGPARLTISLGDNGDLLAGSIAVTRVKDNPKDEEGKAQASIDYWRKAHPVTLEEAKLSANATATAMGLQLMAVGTGYGQIRIYSRDGKHLYDLDLSDYRSVEVKEGKRREPVLDLSFSPDGTKLFVGAKASGDANFVFDFSSGKPIATKIEDQGADISKTVFSSNGVVATADIKGRLVLRDGEGNQLSNFKVPRFAEYLGRLKVGVGQEESNFIKVVPGEERAHLSLYDESWKLMEEKEVKAASNVSSPIIDMRFDGEGDAMIVIQATGMLSYWDVSDPRQPQMRYATRIVNRTDEEATPMHAVHMEALDQALQKAANLSAEEYVNLLFMPIERRLAAEAKTAKLEAEPKVEAVPYDPSKDSSLDSLPDLGFLLESGGRIFNSDSQFQEHGAQTSPDPRNGSPRSNDPSNSIAN